MKQYIFLFFTILSPTAIFSNITFENTLSYDIEISYKICRYSGLSYGRFIDKNLIECQNHSISIPAHSPASLPISYTREGLELLSIIVMKNGNKELVDLQGYGTVARDLYESILSIIPWGNGFRLIRLIQ